MEQIQDQPSAALSRSVREETLARLLGGASRAPKTPGYYPGVGDYYPSKVLAGRMAG